MHTAVRDLVVDQLKRKRPANRDQVIQLFRGLLAENVVREYLDDIIDLWKHQQRNQRQDSDFSLPLSPAASSSTRSHWCPSDVRRSLNVYPQCVADVSQSRFASDDRAV